MPELADDGIGLPIDDLPDALIVLHNGRIQPTKQTQLGLLDFLLGNVLLEKLADTLLEDPNRPQTARVQVRTQTHHPRIEIPG